MTFGCWIDAAASNSCRKRARNSSSVEAPGAITLRATSRLSGRCIARYTIPMPPRPATPRMTCSAKVAPMANSSMFARSYQPLDRKATGRLEDVRAQPVRGEEADKQRNERPHQRMHVARAPGAGHHRDVAEHAEADAGGDRERQRNARDHEEGGDGGLGPL